MSCHGYMRIKRIMLVTYECSTVGHNKISDFLLLAWTRNPLTQCPLVCEPPCVKPPCVRTHAQWRFYVHVFEAFCYYNNLRFDRLKSIKSIQADKEICVNVNNYNFPFILKPVRVLCMSDLY